MFVLFFLVFFLYTLLSQWEFLTWEIWGRFPQGKPAATDPTLTDDDAAADDGDDYDGQDTFSVPRNSIFYVLVGTVGQ